jgi:hypothetical protein
MTIPDVCDFHVNSTFLRGRDVRLVSAGVPRSGSTLVWQVACDIVGPHVPKTHTFLDMPGIPVLLTVRDPRDCMASIWTKDSPTLEPTDEHTLRMVAEYRMWFAHAEFYAERGAAILRYEDFVRNTNIVFDAIDKLLSYSTPQFDRDRIAASHSIETNRRLAESLESSHDPVTHIHPRHIGYVEPGAWTRVFSPFQQAMITRLLGGILQDWNYPRETIT